MKTRLTIEESRHLFELGVPKEKASLKFPIESFFTRIVYGDINKIPIFSIQDFLNGEILPREIFDEANYPFRMESWFVEGTPVWDVQYVGIKESFIQGEELIDALYQLTCWYYSKYLKIKS